MKAILISIKPKWVEKILNGEKTIELRKTMPKCDLPIDVYIYCTKDKKYANLINRGGFLTGMVVAKFTLNKIDEHHVLPTERILPFNWNVEQKLEQLCLTKEEVMAYGKGQDYQAFLWHISNLEIFYKPKELSEFHTSVKKEPPEELLCPECGKPMEYYEYKYLTKAPQSWCYVEIR